MGASKEIWDPLFISATTEAINFKFGIQLGFGTILPKKQRLGRLGPGEHPKKKIWDPLFVSATVEASD